jgi:hypothetical protein
MNDPNYKVFEVSSLKQEDGAHELASSPEMEPYLRYIQAALIEMGVGPWAQAIADLPLEKRYVWRVASALKWGFADFEEWSLIVDFLRISSPEDSSARRCRQVGGTS